MRDYGKVHTSFWTSEDTRALSEDGRVLALYLLTSPHANMIGCFRMPDAYVSDDLQWGFERVAKGFAELSRKGFATRDRANFWVVIHRFMKWNPIENPNQGKGASRLFEQVPDSQAKLLVSRAFQTFGAFVDRTVYEPFINRSVTLPKPLPNQDPDPDPDQEMEPEQEMERIAAVAAPRPTPSKKVTKQSLSSCPDLDDPGLGTWLIVNKIPSLGSSDGAEVVNFLNHHLKKGSKWASWKAAWGTWSRSEWFKPGSGPADRSNTADPVALPPMGEPPPMRADILDASVPQLDRAQVMGILTGANR